MRPGKIIVTSAAAVMICMSAALAQQSAAGVITGINRLNGTIAIQPVQSGTVGANAAGTAEEYKVKDAAMLDTVHAGDRVSFSVAESAGAKTITRLERQK